MKNIRIGNRLLQPERNITMSDDNFQQNQEYDPERDGYRPDRIYNAPPRHQRPPEKPPVRDGGLTTDRKLYRVGLGLIVVSLLLSAASLMIPPCLMGIVWDILAFLLSAAGLGCCIAGGQMRHARGCPWGKEGIAIGIAGVVALLMSNLSFMLVGCRMCAYAATFFWLP